MQDDNTYLLYRAYNPVYPNLGSFHSFIWLTEEVDNARLYLDPGFILAEFQIETPLLVAYPCEVDSLLDYEFDPFEPREEECAIMRENGYDAFICESTQGDALICLLNKDKIQKVTIIEECP